MAATLGVSGSKVAELRLAFVTTEDASSLGSWSGIPYHMARALVGHGVTLARVGPLRAPPATLAVARARQVACGLGRGGYPLQRDPGVARAYAREVALRLRDLEVDAVFSPGTIPIAGLEVSVPVVFWTDATFAAMVDYYPAYCGLSAAGLHAGNEMERAAIERASVAVYASAWAAESAVGTYGADPRKLHTIPLGANLTRAPDRGEVTGLIERRSQRVCRLAFVGVDWRRKGGDLALALVERLVDMGVPSRLTVVGCRAGDVPRSRLIDFTGFLDKSTPQGEAELLRVLGESHFLCLPSHAECFGVVFCEASACGVPSLAIRTGGVASAVRHGANGYLFDETSFVESAAATIAGCMADYDGEYIPLALSSRDEYCTRLNWTTSTRALIERVSPFVAG